MTYDFKNYKEDTLTRPRDAAWTNWAKFEKVGDKVSGYIKDVFYREAQGIYKEQRGITLLQENGVFINLAIKRLDFVLAKTDNLRLGDPLVAELTDLQENDKGNPTKIVSYFGKNLAENVDNKTVKELDQEDQGKGGTVAPEDKTDIMPEANIKAEEIPFP